MTPGRLVKLPLIFIIAPLILSPTLACRLCWTTGSLRRVLRPHLDDRVVLVLAPVVWWCAAVVRGSTVVVVLTVCVFALRPRRRVMRVGFVVRVSTMLLRRLVLKGILGSWLCDELSWLSEVRLMNLKLLMWVFVFLFDMRLGLRIVFLVVEECVKERCS